MVNTSPFEVLQKTSCSVNEISVCNIRYLKRTQEVALWGVLVQASCAARGVELVMPGLMELGWVESEGQ